MEIVETLVKDSQILININTKKTEKKKITIAWFLGTLADTLDASVLGNMSTGDSCQLSAVTYEHCGIIWVGKGSIKVG